MTGSSHASGRGAMLALILVSLCLLASHTWASSRYAILVGSNHGQAGEHPLRYAAKDARQLADVLMRHGMFPQKNVVVLEDPTADGLRSSLARLNVRIRSEVCRDCRSVLLVFYSGHADALSLHLGPTSMSWEEFRDLTMGSSADLRLLIIDACRSGQATRVKGFKLSKPFALLPNDATQTEGFVILSSASAGEEAQESDDLGGSFFTHHLMSALRGAADSNADARVTLAEAYRYTSERTIVSTARTLVGIQHPTFHFEMRGKADLVLSHLQTTRDIGSLELTNPGVYLLHRGKGSNDPLEMEAHVSEKARIVWLPAGPYFVRFRTPDNLQEGQIDIKAGSTSVLNTGKLRQVDYDVLVQKGIIQRQGWESDEIPAFLNAYTLRDGEWEVGLLRPTGVGIAGRFQLSTSIFANSIGFLNLLAKWSFIRTSHFAAAVEAGGGYFFPNKLGAIDGRLIATIPIGHRLYISACAGYTAFTSGSSRSEVENSGHAWPNTPTQSGLNFGGEIELVMNPKNLLIWSVSGGYDFLDNGLMPLIGTFSYAHRWDTFRIMIGLMFSTEPWDFESFQTPILPVLDFWWRW